MLTDEEIKAAKRLVRDREALAKLVRATEAKLQQPRRTGTLGQRAEQQAAEDALKRETAAEIKEEARDTGKLLEEGTKLER